MADYEMVLCDGNIEEIMRRQNKLIVYSVTNERSRELLESTELDGVETMRIDCRTNDQKRAEIFRMFGEASKAIIFNCRVMQEGVDLPECDSVYIE